MGCYLAIGLKTRIALVKLLLTKPDILLLDEPTNHLDIAAIEWLENYVKHYPFAVVLVSHDRMFLDHVVDEIVEIEFGKTQRYVGDYSHYLKAKEEYLKKNHEAYVRQQQEIHRLEDLIEKFRYKKNKAAFAKSKQKYLDRMDKIEDSSSDTSQMKAVFTCARKGGKQVLDVEDLSVGYDKVLSKVSFQLLQGQRMAIVGPNGIGKSTLIKTLVKELPAISGSFKFGHQIDVGYFNQESAQMKSNKNVLDELWDMDPDAKIEDISVGMQQRVEILKVLYRGADILILDEPTASLTPQEITELMEIISNLTADGKSVILITHKLKEITSCADYCTIIRQGKYIDTVKVSDVNENDLAAMMVGRKVEFKVEKKDIKPGEVVLEVKDIHGKDYRGVEILKGLNLSVRRGEIVGLAGVDGNGQTELVEILTGLKKGESGEVLINGKNVFNKKPKEIFDSGITSIPAESLASSKCLPCSKSGSKP